jgi:NAD(P)-dependent dehydrogenase (short-subunit alcohol dehydrogenase family)
MSLLDRFKLDNQVAVVTGGGKGIGEGIAYGLADAGADVVVVSRTTEQIEQVAENIRAMGRNALAITADIMDHTRVHEVVAEVEAKMGRLDCWVSNAGGGDGVARTFMELPEEQWDYQIDLNLKAVWSGAQAASKVMKERGSGTIVNISTILTHTAAPSNGPYTLSKTAVENFTQTLAAELAEFGIRVNAVAPGPIPTEVEEKDLPELAVTLGIPLGRLGDPQDIAPAVVYLASDASSWMTGKTMTIAGGL